MLTVSSSIDIATQVSEYDSSLGDHSVLFVDGIGPIAQYHNYVDVAEAKGLSHFARDYRTWRLNSKSIVKKMPPKNSYGKLSWADIEEDSRLDELADRDLQRLQREADTPYTVPKTKFVSRGSNQVKPPPSITNTRNQFDQLPSMPPLPIETRAPHPIGRLQAESRVKTSVPPIPPDPSLLGEWAEEAPFLPL